MESSGSSNNDLITILEVAHPCSGSSSILFLVKLEFGNAGFLRKRENERNRRNTSRSKGENHQQTRTHIWRRQRDLNPCDKLVEGECSATAPPFHPVLVNSLSQVVRHP